VWTYDEYCFVYSQVLCCQPPLPSAPRRALFSDTEPNMATSPSVRTGGQILIDQLRCQGVERVTCVPGESYLAALDALYDSGAQVVICRNEGGAAMMAEAYGKLTGRPGVCFVTRGPGATNACHGVHIAAPTASRNSWPGPTGWPCRAGQGPW